MESSAERLITAPVPRASVEEAVQQFTASLRAGADWFDALLQAVAQWPAAEEIHDGRHYQYLLGDEAFDWMLLAERLLVSADGLAPEEERDRLLFHGIPPRQVPDSEFKAAIGSAKYRAVCNYWYGVTVEEALILAVEHEIRKQLQGLLHLEEQDLDEAVYRRIYGQSCPELLGQFFAERHQPARDESTLTELKEFTYWLFKRRLAHSEPARLASDTKKGLDLLECLGRPHLLAPSPCGWQGGQQAQPDGGRAQST